MDVTPSRPEEFAELIGSELAKWAKVAKPAPVPNSRDSRANFALA